MHEMLADIVAPRSSDFATGIFYTWFNLINELQKTRTVNKIYLSNYENGYLSKLTNKTHIPCRSQIWSGNTANVFTNLIKKFCKLK